MLTWLPTARRVFQFYFIFLNFLQFRFKVFFANFGFKFVEKFYFSFQKLKIIIIIINKGASWFHFYIRKIETGIGNWELVCSVELDENEIGIGLGSTRISRLGGFFFLFLIFFLIKKKEEIKLGTQFWF